MFVATRDAVGEVVGAALSSKSRSKLPWYVQPEAGEGPQGLSGGDLEKAVLALQLRFPENVKVH